MISSSAAIDLLAQRQNVRVGIGYFYFTYDDRHNQTAAKVCASILQQLLDQLDALPTKLRIWYEERSKAVLPDKKKLLELIVSCSGSFSLMFVLFDGLDECVDAQQDDLIDIIWELRNSGVSVLLTSRPGIECRVDKVQPVQILPITAVEDDITLYVNAKLGRRPDLSTEDKNALKDSLLGAADGM